MWDLKSDWNVVVSNVKLFFSFMHFIVLGYFQIPQNLDGKYPS